MSDIFEHKARRYKYKYKILKQELGGGVLQEGVRTREATVQNILNRQRYEAQIQEKSSIPIPSYEDYLYYQELMDRPSYDYFNNTNTTPPSPQELQRAYAHNKAVTEAYYAREQAIEAEKRRKASKAVQIPQLVGGNPLQERQRLQEQINRTNR
jgi:hypothetical protein